MSALRILHHPVVDHGYLSGLYACENECVHEQPEDLVCRTCRDRDGMPLAWPCETAVRALLARPR